MLCIHQNILRNKTSPNRSGIFFDVFTRTIISIVELMGLRKQKHLANILLHKPINSTLHFYLSSVYVLMNIDGIYTQL